MYFCTETRHGSRLSRSGPELVVRCARQFGTARGHQLCVTTASLANSQSQKPDGNIVWLSHNHGVSPNILF
jgi:hypothetical protein